MFIRDLIGSGNVPLIVGSVIFSVVLLIAKGIAIMIVMRRINGPAQRPKPPRYPTPPPYQQPIAPIPPYQAPHPPRYYPPQPPTHAP